MARTILAEHRARPIREAIEGMTVKVVGVVRAAAATLRAPLTGRECVYFDVRMEEAASDDHRESSDERKRSRRRVSVRDREAVDFVVEDESGRALVRTGDVQVVVLRDVDESVRGGERPEVDELLRLHGHSPRSLTVREGSIAIGERVAVVGEASWTFDDDAPGPESYRLRPQLLVLSTTADHPLIVSDDPETFD